MLAWVYAAIYKVLIRSVCFFFLKQIFFSFFSFLLLISRMSYHGYTKTSLRLIFFIINFHLVQVGWFNLVWISTNNYQVCYSSKTESRIIARLITALVQLVFLVSLSLSLYFAQSLIFRSSLHKTHFQHILFQFYFTHLRVFLHDFDCTSLAWQTPFYVHTQTRNKKNHYQSSKLKNV